MNRLGKNLREYKSLGSLMVERHPYTVDTGVQFSNEVPNIKGKHCMSKSEDVINRAYRNVPKEVSGFNMDLDGLPFKGIKYYWLLLKRKFTR